MPTVLALGLDPSVVELTASPSVTPELVRAFIESQLERVRAAGYEVVSCLVDLGETAEAVTARCLESRRFDCVVLGAGLRDHDRVMLFEKLLNLVHARAPGAKLCFNTHPRGHVGGGATLGLVTVARSGPSSASQPDRRDDTAGRQMARDRRFVAKHRGGPLDPARHRLLAAWAADCAERVLPLFAQRYPKDPRPTHAIESARAWARGDITVGVARRAAVEAHAAAREATDDAARAAARAAGHAVATAHMADHALGPVYYGVKAVKASAPAADASSRAQAEHRWQRTRLPEDIRELVSSAIDDGTVLGRWWP